MNAATVLGVLDPLVGMVGAIVGALVLCRRQADRAGALLLLGAGCWFLGAVVPSLATLHRGALVHLLVTYPSGRTRHTATLAVVALGWVLAAVGGTPVGPWSALAVAGLLGAVAIRSAARDAARGRPVLTAPMVAALSFAAVLVVAGTNVVADVDADLAVALAYDIAVGLVVLALGTDVLRARTSDDAVADVLTGLGSAQDDASGLERRLRRVLGDPELEIGYWSPDRELYVDEQGQEIGNGRQRAFTGLTEDGRPAAGLFHDPALLDDPGLLEGALAAVRLTLANAAMRREALDRVTRLSEARRRLVEAADVEARSLAHRLEAGPQARLREVWQALTQVDTSHCAASPTGAAVLQELAAAQRELQELGRGIRPHALTEGGLSLALPCLTLGTPGLTDLSVEVGRLDAAVEAGLYFFCAEGIANAAKHASASRIGVTVRAERGAVVAEVVDDGIGGAQPTGSGLRGLKDRIEALGGTFEVRSESSGGVRLVARVPTEGTARA